MARPSEHLQVRLRLIQKSVDLCMFEARFVVCSLRLRLARPANCQLRPRAIYSMAPKRKQAANVESEFTAPAPKPKKPKPKKLTEPETDEQGWTAHPPSLIYKCDRPCLTPPFLLTYCESAFKAGELRYLVSRPGRIKKPAAAASKIAAFDLVRRQCLCQCYKACTHVCHSQFAQHLALLGLAAASANSLPIKSISRSVLEAVQTWRLLPERIQPKGHYEGWSSRQIPVQTSCPAARPSRRVVIQADTRGYVLPCCSALSQAGIYAGLS